MNDIGEYRINGYAEVAGQISADEDAKKAGIHKRFTLRMNFPNVPLRDIVSGALASKKITWANSNRKRYESIVNGQKVEVNFTAPATRMQTPEEIDANFMAQFEVASPERQAELIEEMKSRMSS